MPALLASCLLSLVGSVAVATPAQAADRVVLSNDFESDSYAPWLPRGPVTLATAPEGRESGSSLSVTDRTANWQGTATSVTTLFEPGATYVIGAWAKLPAGTEGSAGVHFTVEATPAAGGDNTYTWVGDNVTTTADTWVRIGGSYTMPAGLTSATLYVEADGTTPYLLDDVSITTPDGTGGPEPGTVVINTDFEDGLDGWGPRDGGPGAPTVARTDVAHGGAAAALVSDRVNQGAGLGREVGGLFETGATYEFSAWLRFAEGQPTDQVWLSLASTAGDSQSFSTLAQFDGITNTGWTEVTASFTMPAADSALLYLETRWQDGETGNTSDLLVDDIVVRVPQPPVIETLTPIHETTDFPVGVAIDSRETVGAAAQLLTRHFTNITPENHMKPEAWYDAERTFRPHEQAIALTDFARDNNLGLYGHVLVWHSQTPPWFFQDSAGAPLGTSAADQQILRDRLRTHIFAVAESLSDRYGPFGSDTNPVNAFDVVNEVVSDSGEFADGLRRSEWYRILGENFIDLAFQYADQAFNDVHAVAGADPVKLFINDYNTEQSGKQARYRALVERLVARGVPVDGVGHQFHVSLATPVSSLESALAAFEDLPVTQAVTELDVTTGTPVTQANLIEQGYFFRDAFRIFRAYADHLSVVTVWGLTDGRSWRSGNGAPLVFDDSLRAKPAYHGAVDGELPARLRTANVFAGSVALTGAATADLTWRQLPLHPIEEVARFQLRWAPDHLTAYVSVDDPAASAGDEVSFVLADRTYTVARDGTGDVPAVAADRDGGYAVVAHLPLTGAAQGDTRTLDVRVADNGETAGWNSPGAVGTLTLVEPLSYLEVTQARTAPEVDGAVEDAWADARAVTTTKQVSGTDGAIATVRTLWRDRTLYVLAEVADPVVDVSGSDPWVQDSVEIYVDAGNAKNGPYRYDDTQIRINADNVVSFGTGDEAFQAGRLTSAAVRTGTGYTVEAAISLLEYGGPDTFHGLDFQVNDASDGARAAIRNWADPVGTGYQATARWGVGRLVGPTTGNVDIVLRNMTRWDSDSGGGYCATVVATNPTGQPVDWYGYLELDGEIYDAWNFQRQVQADGTYRISGVGWNRTLKPGASTVSVGYCANW
ncbi:endo-1,4-beta-xylanase [Plantactinospora sp. B5E13]|uniref:endo-1,4-beta-xylanase n=1 Tax=Plantactinospora sp. B5E13 TaxID=3153758 RepID=UPI00325D5788